MKHAHLTIATLLSAAALLLPACDRNPSSWKTPNMTALSPRLQPLFEKTKTVCFGRFVIDVPQTAQVIWGPAQVPWDITTYPNGVEMVRKMAVENAAQLQAERNIHHNKPSLISQEEVDQPPGKIITGFADFQTLERLTIHGYFAVGSLGVYMKSKDQLDEPLNRAGQIRDMARRLRPRAETEAPTEPGTCIANAFLPDAPDTKPEDINEHIRVGFRLKEFGDVHLSIYTSPGDEQASDSNRLEVQIKRGEASGKLSRVKFFRRGQRDIHDWNGGFEVLTLAPQEENAHSYHDFLMDFMGKRGNPLQPHVDVALKTGVDRDLAGLVKPSITDEEAIALWDKLTGSIRVRPTSTKTSEAPAPKVSLGQQATTGRLCAQTGWWECADELPFAQGSGVWLQEGQPMPRVQVWDTPNLWQRLKGERTQNARATLWRLAAYEAPAAPPSPHDADAKAEDDPDAAHPRNKKDAPTDGSPPA